MPFQARFAPIKANLLLQLNVIVIIFIAKHQTGGSYGKRERKKRQPTLLSEKSRIWTSSPSL